MGKARVYMGTVTIEGDSPIYCQIKDVLKELYEIDIRHKEMNKTEIIVYREDK